MRDDVGKKFVLFNGKQIEVTEELIRKISEQKQEKFDKGTALFVYDDGQVKRRCGTCPMFLKDIDKCSIHGPDYYIDGKSMVCGYWIPGEPTTSKEHKPMKSVTPEISGLVNTTKGGTHCASCIHFDKENLACEIVKGQITENDCCAFWENPEEELPYKNTEE